MARKPIASKTGGSISATLSVAADVPAELLQRLSTTLRPYDHLNCYLDYFLKGTVLKRMMKCGQPQCACHRDPAKRHGPYFEWTYRVKGKTVNVKLSPQAAPLYQAATKRHRKLKAVLARMERLSRTALARLAKREENTD